MANKTRPPTASISENKVTLDGRVISYTIRRSARARWIRLEMRPESGLTVVIPRARGTGCLPRILKAKQGWILCTLARYEKVQSQFARTEIRAGDAISYLGRRLTVLTEKSSGETDCVRLEQNRLTASLACVGKELNVVLEQWYRTQAAELVAEKVEKWSARLGVSHNGITIRGQKTRWGSCSAKGGLSFNWKLLMAPEAVIDYVVIHELAHLKEMNHSKRFWQLVARHCSAWRELRKWLKTHEADITVGLFACK